MKNLKKLEKILLIIITFAVLFSISTVNKATTTADPNELFDQIPYKENEQTPTPIQNTNTNTETNINTNTNTNTAIPQLGANDTAMWVLIAVCAVAAVYTYRKVRDYNI